MSLVSAPMQRPAGVMNTAPQITPQLPNGAMNAQSGYNGSAGAGMSPLVQALLQAKMKQRLAGNFPGTAPQGVPPTPGMPAAAAPGYFSPQAAAQQPLSLGAAPMAMPGQ
jgi:hypothetical protein